MIKQAIIAAALAGTFSGTPAIAAEQEAIFAGGCFWCIEKDFEHVRGVREVKSGYIGGDLKKPTYKNHSGHVEAVKIFYDDSKVSYDELLHTFWRTVDPTDKGGQFCDRGYAYTTAVFAVNSAQKQAAAQSKKQAQKELGKTVVTPIRDATFWTDSEGYHQDYYKKNPIRYNYYRKSCGRDAKVKALWGKAAYPGVDKSS